MTWTVIAVQNGEGHVLSYDTEMDAVLGALGMAVTGYRTWTARVDDRGVEYLENVENVDDLPPGWALCGTCRRGWNDVKSTSVTPTPSARCPFEYEHAEERTEAHTVTIAGDVWADLQERWTGHVEQRENVRRLAVKAEEDDSYAEYDEACTDLWEMGNELAGDLASALGLDDRGGTS